MQKLAVLFDNIDPIKGPLPNILTEYPPSMGEKVIERFLTSLFSDFNLTFIPSYFVSEQEYWIYPIFLNNLFFMNSIDKIRESLPKNILSEYKKRPRRKGRIILFILEPINDFETFGYLAATKNADLIFCTHHKSETLYKNVIDVDMCLLERHNGYIYDTPSEESLQFYDKRIFSSFLYFYEDCAIRKKFLTFVQEKKLEGDMFISAKDYGKGFFNCLNIEEALEKSFINIIFEADIFWKGRSILTEKVWRCVESEKPFIIMSHKGALKYFRDQGFKTFSNLIDESYDEIDNDKSRVKAVFTEVLRLSKLKHTELTELNNELRNVFDHNKETLKIKHKNAQQRIFEKVKNR